MKRAVTILVILAAFGGVGWKVYQKYTAKRSETKKGTASVAVEVAPVRRATIHEIVKPSGDLMARSEFVVAPKVAGRLVKLLADIGDTVTNGQLIAVLDDEEYNQQVAQAEAELEVAKASVEEAGSTLDAAQREFDRVEALRGKKIASESELDESRSQYRTALARNKVAQSQVAQKQALLEAAKVRQSYTQIRARWTEGGQERMVGERFADAGAMLKANDPIVSVVDIDELTAVIHVTEKEYGRMQVGQTVGVTCNDAYPGKVFAGKVLRLAPLIKQTSREARVEIQVKNPERLLRPGMFIGAQIEIARHENATVVPDAAIARRDEQPAVFLADRKTKKAKLVKVQPGLTEGHMVEIVSPALEGSVITIGQFQLEDGTAIAISNEQPAATQAAEAGASEAKAEAKS